MVYAELSFRKPTFDWSWYLRLAAFLGPAALYAMIFIVIPYANLLIYSFWKTDNYAIVRDFNVGNFARVVQSPVYLSVIGNSLLVASIVTLFAVGVSPAN